MTSERYICRSLLVSCALLLTAPTPGFGQQVSTTFSDRGVQEQTQFDGRTLVHETRGQDGFVQVERVDVTRLDRRAATLQSTPTIAAIVVQCVSQSRCIETTATVIGQVVKDTTNEMSVRCRPADCARLHAALTGRPLPAGTPAAPTTVECERLRATYAASGRTTTLPPECTTEAERAATYRPGVQTPQRPPDPEPVIDGSKIPSRIDFTKPSPTPAPVAPSPADAPRPSPSIEPSFTAPPVRPPIVPETTRTEPPAVDAPKDVSEYRSLFDRLKEAAEEIGSAFARTARSWRDAVYAARDWVKEHAPELGVSLFEEEATRAFDPAIEPIGPDNGHERFSPLRFLVKETISDAAQKLGVDAASRAAFGKAYSDLPEEFRKFQDGQDATFEQIGGSRLNGGLKQGEAMGELFDTWDK